MWRAANQPPCEHTLHNRTNLGRVLRHMTLLACTIALIGGHAVASVPSVADLDARSRAGGNRIDIAQRVGESIFATKWPAQVLQVTANQLDTHLIVGMRLSGVKFHETLSRQDFTAEIAALVARAFSSSSAEEVDLWAAIPIDVAKGVIVSGDLAKPTSRDVFTLSVKRGESTRALTARIMGGTGVYWDQEWARTAFKQGT